jgi:hypothetical protein
MHAEPSVTVGAIGALVGRQLADGSWPSEPMLLVPGPAAKVGSAAARAGPAHADERRTFTTATVLSALNAARARSWMTDSVVTATF